MPPASLSTSERKRMRTGIGLVDVAREAGVSVSVVSSALNGGASGNTRVGKATAERIVEVAKRLNYRPSPMARQLRGKRSKVFGLLVASAGDPLRSYLVEFLDEEAVKHGCQTLIGNTVVSPGRFDACVDEFVSRGVDGIFCAVHPEMPGDRQLLLDRCPNTVFYEDPGVPACTFISIDQVAAGGIAVQHLVGQGRRRIGFAIADPGNHMLVGRLAGYRAELRTHGLGGNDALVYAGACGSSGPLHPQERVVLWHRPAEELDGVIDQLIVRERADAIVAHDDFLAASLLRRLRARGISVPRQVAVVGFLNHYLCDHVDPPLTSVDLRHHVAARTMVATLEDMILSPAGPTKVRRPLVIEPVLVVRESA
jgi:DNA-binding LacI/PurR family transcriptional regulator